MGQKDEWTAQVEKWKRRYGDPSEDLRTIDLTKIQLNKVCKKRGCGSKHGLHRHHKGHEYLFACLMPNIYAYRYLEFRSEDCITLCDICHRLIHHHYLQVIKEMNYQRIDEPTTKELCEAYRKQLVEICEYWVGRPFTVWEKNVRKLWKWKKPKHRRKKKKK